ncbi:hypothetical protein NIES37_06440 [Tolypothrix tenuis PCC 7101]|uniref:Uncharacterized protein n=1 Tax=Tolypothrix tenuis PCC 7101 TaxID=231146 RepID=A0A1Z4MTD4_9CYAN|nr:hypothetical protein NIES37_06440 [Tolypothrix tenuis PCC 7101]BAZ72784.1 hypothetical protein NIES50_13400 [Aulosira laxa NIES-50]
MNRVCTRAKGQNLFLPCSLLPAPLLFPHPQSPPHEHLCVIHPPTDNDHTGDASHHAVWVDELSIAASE